MICPTCGSHKVSEYTDDAPKMYSYWCLECQDGFNEGDFEAMADKHDEELICLYTDGACSRNPGPAGAGVLMRYKQHEKRISKFLGNATNNIAELTAIKIALESVTDNSKKIIIYTDSQYSIGVLSNPTWKPKKNKELIIEIKNLLKTFRRVNFEWVKGHSDHSENNIVDELAVRAYRDRKDFESRGTINTIS